MPAVTPPLLGHVDWTTPQTLWSHWLGDPLAAVTLLVATVAYAHGLRQLWGRHGRGAAVRVWQARAFAAGAAVVAVALLSPLDGVAHALLSAHMVQHLLLVLVAAPLLVLGAPMTALMEALPPRWRRRAHRLRAGRRTRRLLHGSFVGVAAACLAHIAVMWVWHLPALYETAVASTLVHAVEHGTMLGTGMWVWGAIVQRGGPLRRVRPSGALAMFLTGTLTVGLAPLMTFSPEPWYAIYADRATTWGLSPLVDQQMAGAIMWGIGGVFYPVAGAVLLALWLRSDQRTSPGQSGSGRSPWWQDTLPVSPREDQPAG